MIKRTFSYLVLLAMSFIAPSSVFAQHIVGVVQNNTTKQPIVNAEILLKDKDHNVIDRVFSDQDGAFSYQGDPESGVQIILAQAQGHNSSEVSIGSLEQANINFSLNTYVYQQPKVQSPATGVAQSSAKSVVASKAVHSPSANQGALYDVSYDHNSSYFNSANLQELAQVVAHLKKQASTKVHITGFAYTKSNAQYNQWLAQRRVERIAQYLQAQGFANLDIVTHVKQTNHLPSNSVEQYRKCEISF